jgi:hypothetical protein
VVVELTIDVMLSVDGVDHVVLHLHVVWYRVDAATLASAF